MNLWLSDVKSDSPKILVDLPINHRLPEVYVCSIQS